MAKPSSLWPRRICRIITNAEPFIASLTSGAIQTLSCAINKNLRGTVVVGSRNTESGAGLSPVESKGCSGSTASLSPAYRS